jgi:hypothetical protein
VRHGLLASIVVTAAGLTTGCAQPSDPCLNVERVPWYEDRDRDGFGNPSVAILSCEAGVPDGYLLDASDCDDLREAVYPGAPELCDGLDNDCSGGVDDGLPVQSWFLDADGDGYGADGSFAVGCDVPENGAEVAGDCDDTRANANPDAIEVCDGFDNDCDGLTDDDDDSLDPDSAIAYFPDLDGDGFGAEGQVERACEPPPEAVFTGTDCDDAQEFVNPDANEVCDGFDNDCDLLVDDTDPSLIVFTQTQWFVDADLDGFGDPSTGFFTCTEPWFAVQDGTDCDDTDPTLAGPDTTTWLEDLDQDGVGAGLPVGTGCTPPIPGAASLVLGEDCDDGDPLNHPGRAEVCDGQDNDCDALVDLDDDDLDDSTTVTVYRDLDADGFAGPPEPSCVPLPPPLDFGDCDDGDPLVYPGQVEVCDGVDNDCNGFTDDDDPLLDTTGLDFFFEDLDGDGLGNPTSGDPFCAQPPDRVPNQGDCNDGFASIGVPDPWWLDLDGDGFGAGAVSAPSCLPPTGDHVRVALGEDCDDAAPSVSPGAFDACGDGLDADCDGIDPFCPRPSCAALLMEGVTTDGVYTLDPGDGNGPKAVYCDQTADGGGWTLVSSSTYPVDDQAAPYASALSTLTPTATMDGLWAGMRSVVTGNTDMRFTCKEALEDEAMAVDLVFYDVHWYLELTAGTDDQTCFNEDNGVGYDLPPPARRNLLTNQLRTEGNHWDRDGYLEGEDQCASFDDFSIDFDDRGMDGNQYDGTDWGEDDGLVKCADTNSGAAWFIWIR